MALFFFPFFFFLNLDNAPATIVGLVGRKEYEQCAKDLYFFIQVIFIPVKVNNSLWKCLIETNLCLLSYFKVVVFF